MRSDHRSERFDESSPRARSKVRILVRALFGAMPLESAVDRGAAQRREAEFLT